MSGPTYSVVEGTGGTTSASVAVVRYGGSLGSVSISYTISDGTASAGSDYSATASGTLTWGDGDTSAKLIPISIVADSNAEPDETIQIALSPATCGARCRDRAWRRSPHRPPPRPPRDRSSRASTCSASRRRTTSAPRPRTPCR